MSRETGGFLTQVGPNTRFDGNLQGVSPPSAQAPRAAGPALRWAGRRRPVCITMLKHLGVEVRSLRGGEAAKQREKEKVGSR